MKGIFFGSVILPLSTPKGRNLTYPTSLTVVNSISGQNTSLIGNFVLMNFGGGMFGFLVSCFYTAFWDDHVE